MRYVYLTDKFGCFCGMQLLGFDDNLPAGSVDVSPPPVSDHQSAKWSGSDWEIVTDYRRSPLYHTTDGTPAFIDAPGELPPNLTTKVRPSEEHVWTGTNWEVPDNVLEQINRDKFVTNKAAKLQQLNAAAQAYIDRAAETDKVPDFEMQTWVLQAAESKAWAADNAASTPVLDQIAASRGIDAAKLKEAALRKTLVYEALTAHIAGQRQALQSKIEAAKTQAELDKVVIAFTPLEASE